MLGDFHAGDLPVELSRSTQSSDITTFRNLNFASRQLESICVNPYKAAGWTFTGEFYSVKKKITSLRQQPSRLFKSITMRSTIDDISQVFIQALDFSSGEHDHQWT